MSTWYPESPPDDEHPDRQRRPERPDRAAYQDPGPYPPAPPETPYPDTYPNAGYPDRAYPPSGEVHELPTRRSAQAQAAGAASHETQYLPPTTPTGRRSAAADGATTPAVPRGGSRPLIPGAGIPLAGQPAGTYGDRSQPAPGHAGPPSGPPYGERSQAPAPYPAPPGYGDQPPAPGLLDQQFADQQLRDRVAGDQPYAGQQYTGQPYGDQQYAGQPYADPAHSGPDGGPGPAGAVPGEGSPDTGRGGELHGRAAGQSLSRLLAALAWPVMAIGLFVPESGSSAFGRIPAWSVFALACLVLVGVGAFGGPQGPGSGRTWTLGVVGAGGLVAFWVLLVLPAIAQNTSFALTLGTALATAGVWLTPGPAPQLTLACAAADPGLRRS